MRALPRRAGVVVVAVLGLAGLGLAHVLEYLALAPDAHVRNLLLADTGHGYLPSAVGTAAFLAALGLALVFLAGMRRGAGVGVGVARRLETADWARFLPMAQAVAFVALEVGERLAAGSSLADLGPVLVLGLPLQVLAGLAGGWLLSALARVGEHVGRVLAGRRPVSPRRPASGWRPAAAWLPVPRLAGGPTPARGPPLHLAVA